GLNAPKKRRTFFHKLKKLNLDLICIQESHICNKDDKYLIQKALGQEFIASGLKKKNGVVIYAKQHLNPKLKIKDKDGRFIGVEIEMNGIKILILGIYAPNTEKQKFFEVLRDKILTFDYENWCLLGDWNGVIGPSMDKLASKDIKATQGKLPKSFFDLMEILQLQDMWRYKNGNAKDYTYFSERHKSLSRIDMILISKTITNLVMEVDILPKTLADHNPVKVVIGCRTRKSKWRLNEYILKKEEMIQQCKRKLREYFEDNLGKGTPLNTVWDASKAFMRGHLIRMNNEMKKKKQAKAQKLSEEIKKKERELKQKPDCQEMLRNLKILQKELSMMDVEEMEKKLTYLKQRNFESANKPGKFHKNIELC
uniref:exodeoxyribonuclease III n=1 Tax=Salvator merianae TaxID=96440 RepID=A0A8D0B4D1_SALMN